jgi:hypothetical protein
MQTDVPAEMDAEQARQVLGQERPGAAQPDQGDHGVKAASAPAGCGVRIEGLDAVACRVQGHPP